jgi:hypothetical protein
MTYKTSLDKTAIRITISVTILFAIIIGGQYSIIKDAGSVLRMQEVRFPSIPQQPAC